MTRQEVEAAVITAITEIQGISGRECPKITAKTIPIGGVPGFDSLNGLEATILIDKRLGIETPDDARLFTNETGERAIPIAEIAQRIVEFIESREGKAHVK
ncbi:MAG: hypothetical protein IH987_01350 [Planctomycetes bacterium]|nr:hypothetical protein [Planctomycetota bacterium]